MRITSGQTFGGKSKAWCETDAYHVNVKEMCSAGVLPGIHDCTRDDGTNRETTGEGPVLRKNNLVRIIVGVKES